MDNAPDDPRHDARQERERSYSRRALLRAGWAVPFVVVVSPPRLLRAGDGDIGESQTDGGDIDPTRPDPDIRPTEIGHTPAYHDDENPTHHDGGHVDLGDSSGGTYHSDYNPGHQDREQHWDQAHFDQAHTDATHIDDGWTHHFDHGHADTQHADYGFHADEITNDTHQDGLPHHDVDHQDSPPNG